MVLFNKKDKTQKDYYEFTQIVSSLETLTDTLEQEISDFLVRIIRNQPSDEQSQEIVEILNAVSNLERIGDHCEILMKLLNRLHEKNLSFTEDAEAEINALAAKVREMLLLITDNITLRKTNIMVRAASLEDIINKMRHNLRDGHIKRLNEGSCDVNQGLVFIDMLSSFEKIGDHAFNIAQSISGLR
jgi:phosphate:Na+ symporter